MKKGIFVLLVTLVLLLSSCKDKKEEDKLAGMHYDEISLDALYGASSEVSKSDIINFLDDIQSEFREDLKDCEAKRDRSSWTDPMSKEFYNDLQQLPCDSQIEEINSRINDVRSGIISGFEDDFNTDTIYEDDYSGMLLRFNGESLIFISYPNNGNNLFLTEIGRIDGNIYVEDIMYRIKNDTYQVYYKEFLENYYYVDKIYEGNNDFKLDYYSKSSDLFYSYEVEFEQISGLTELLYETEISYKENDSMIHYIYDNQGMMTMKTFSYYDDLVVLLRYTESQSSSTIYIASPIADGWDEISDFGRDLYRDGVELKPDYPFLISPSTNPSFFYMNDYSLSTDEVLLGDGLSVSADTMSDFIDANDVILEKYNQFLDNFEFDIVNPDNQKIFQSCDEINRIIQESIRLFTSD